MSDTSRNNGNRQAQVLHSKNELLSVFLDVIMDYYIQVVAKDVNLILVSIAKAVWNEHSSVGQID